MQLLSRVTRSATTNMSDSFSRASIPSTTRESSALERPLINSTRSSTSSAAERLTADLESGVRSPTPMTPRSRGSGHHYTFDRGYHAKRNYAVGNRTVEILKPPSPKRAFGLGRISFPSRHRDWNDYFGHCPLEHRCRCASPTQGQWSLGWYGQSRRRFHQQPGQAFLYVVVTLFAAYEGIRATAIVLKDVIAAGARLLWQGISNTASFAWNNVIVPTARFLAPAAEFVWNNVVVKAATLIKDVVVWSFQNVVRPVFEFIGPALKFVWDNVLYPVLDATFWAIGKVFEGAFWTIGKVLEGTFKVLSFLYKCDGSVSRFIRSLAAPSVKMATRGIMGLQQCSRSSRSGYRNRSRRILPIRHRTRRISSRVCCTKRRKWHCGSLANRCSNNLSGLRLSRGSGLRLGGPYSTHSSKSSTPHIAANSSFVETNLREDTLFETTECYGLFTGTRPHLRLSAWFDRLSASTPHRSQWCRTYCVPNLGF